MLQGIFGTLNASPPQYIRPLRMSFQIENTSPVLNLGGSVRVYSLDNPLVVSATTGATYGLAATFVNPVAGFMSLISDAPDVIEYTAAELVKEHEFVSPPCSYPTYNTYYSFVPFSYSVDATAIASGDLMSMVYGVSTPFAAGTTLTTGTVAGALGGLPPLRGFLLAFPATVSAQTYRFCIRRQDGARYPVNTLGATFSTVHPKATARGEDALIRTVTAVNQQPAVARPTSRYSTLGGVVSRLSSDMVDNWADVMEATGYAGAAYNAVGGAAGMSKGLKAASMLL